jgi:hypothetical protein
MSKAADLPNTVQHTQHVLAVMFAKVIQVTTSRKEAGRALVHLGATYTAYRLRSQDTRPVNMPVEKHKSASRQLSGTSVRWRTVRSRGHTIWCF